MLNLYLTCKLQLFNFNVLILKQFNKVHKTSIIYKYIDEITIL